MATVEAPTAGDVIVEKRIRKAHELLLGGGRVDALDRISDVFSITDEYADEPWDQLMHLLNLMRALGFPTNQVAAVRDLV